MSSSAQFSGSIICIPVAKPEHAKVTEGESVNFYLTEVECTGLSFQWYINRHDGWGWVKIPGAKLPYHLTKETTLENNGYEYYCEVTYPSSSTVKSNTTLLTVTKKPPKTGDDSNVALWCALGACSIGVILTVVLRKKKESK